MAMPVQSRWANSQTTTRSMDSVFLNRYTESQISIFAKAFSKMANASEPSKFITTHQLMMVFVKPHLTFASKRNLELVRHHSAMISLLSSNTLISQLLTSRISLSGNRTVNDCFRLHALGASIEGWLKRMSLMMSYLIIIAWFRSVPHAITIDLKFKS